MAAVTPSIRAKVGAAIEGVIKDAQMIDDAKKAIGKAKRIDVTEVVHHGEALVVPESMSTKQAIEVLQRKLIYDDEPVALNIRFDTFLLDGAQALQKALHKKYGWVGMQVIPPTFFDPARPPQMIGVNISAKETIHVPWGRIMLPGVEGYLETGMEKTNDGRLCFVLHGTVKRKHMKAVEEIVALTKKFLETDSIYKGKAVRIRFKDSDGDALEMPEPRFLDLSNVKEHELIYSDDVNRAIQASLFTPIERAEECRALGIPLKRGVLLAGPFGVGKTLAAYVAAYKAEKAGWTFVYCETAPELADVVRFAQQYAPAVVFCEDIDRVVSGDRDIDMDQILSIVDGIESKESEILIVLTTNEVKNINQAMLRPGRLDSVVNVTPPDPGAVVRLIHLYARGILANGEDLTEVGVHLAGQIPAVIRECVERSKLHALRLSQPGEEVRITSEALLSAAMEMEFALNLLVPKAADTRSEVVKAAQITADAIKSLPVDPTSNHGKRIVESVVVGH
jgi:transitional endoplasmic reticulum ATPase